MPAGADVVIQIVTGRRLHFGLFSPAPVPELDLVFGGIGAMINAPGIELQAWPAQSWSITGAMAERATQVVEMLRNNPAVPRVKEPLEIQIHYAAPAHQGWGTGTQLALAIAKARCHLSEHQWNAREAARWVGRGLRSGIGVSGFDCGGFLIDYGKAPGDTSPSHVDSIPLPKEWTWLVIEPNSKTGVFGEAEQTALAKITKPDCGMVKELMHLGQQILPRAAREGNFRQFAETLTRYNRLAGSFYREIQGGKYSSSEIESRIELLRAKGAVGVGQSSWGPGIFCLFPDRQTAIDFQSRCKIPDCKMLLGGTSEGTYCVISS